MFVVVVVVVVVVALKCVTCCCFCQICLLFMPAWQIGPTQFVERHEP